MYGLIVIKPSLKLFAVLLPLFVSCLCLGSIQTSSNSEDNYLFEALTKYMLNLSWRNVIFITKEGEKPLQRQLSTLFISGTIYPFNNGSMFNSRQYIDQMEKRHCKIMVSSEIDDQVKIIEWAVQLDLFEKDCTWLFITKQYEELKNLLRNPKVQKSLRPDSQVFAFTEVETRQNHLSNWTHTVCKLTALGLYPTDEIPCQTRALYSHLNGWKISLEESKYYPLQGFTLNAGTTELPPFSLITKEGDKTYYEGECYVLVDLFAQYLGFTPRYIIGTSGGYIPLPNGSWVGLMGMLQKKELDFMTIPVSVTAPRLDMSDFTSYQGTFLMAAIIRKPENNAKVYQYSTYTKPFPSSIWLLILLMSVFVVGCLIVLAWSERTIQHISSLKKVASFMLWQVACCFLQQDFTFLPKYRSGLIPLLLYMMFVLVVSQIYCSFLTASLTIKPDLGVYGSIEELLDDGKYGITIKPEAMLGQLKIAKDGTFARIWKKMKDDPKSTVASDLEGYDRAYKEKFVYIAEPGLSDHFMKKNCSFVYIKKPVKSGTFHYVMSQNSPYLEAFRQKLLLSQSSGVLKRITNTYSASFEPDFDCPVSIPLPTTSFHQAIGPFLVYTLGVCLATVAFITELLYEKFCL